MAVMYVLCAVCCCYLTFEEPTSAVCCVGLHCCTVRTALLSAHRLHSCPRLVSTLTSLHHSLPAPPDDFFPCFHNPIGASLSHLSLHRMQLFDERLSSLRLVRCLSG